MTFVTYSSQYFSYYLINVSSALLLSQNIQFRAPVLLGDTLTVTLEVTEKHGKRPWVTLGCTVENQEGKAVAKGEAQVAAPTEKETVTVVPPPAIQLLEEASLASMTTSSNSTLALPMA